MWSNATQHQESSRLEVSYRIIKGTIVVLIGRHHVFEDLLPYICTFVGCKEELRQFPSLRAWTKHEILKHRSYLVWKCPECPLEYDRANAWSTHVQEDHGRALVGPQNSSAAEAACRRRPVPINEEKCQLCNDFSSTKERDIRTHMGMHMEEIALMALPKEHEGTSDDALSSDDDGRRVSQNASTRRNSEQLTARDSNNADPST